MTLWSHSSPSAAPSVLREPVVYVVDDDASMRQALDGLLRSIGLQVQTFETSVTSSLRPNATCPVVWCSMCVCAAKVA